MVSGAVEELRALLASRYGLLVVNAPIALIAWIGLELMWEGSINANAALHLGLPLPAPHAEVAH